MQSFQTHVGHLPGLTTEQVSINSKEPLKICSLITMKFNEDSTTEIQLETILIFKIKQCISKSPMSQRHRKSANENEGINIL